MTDQLDKAFWDQQWDRLFRDHSDAMGARGPNAQLIAEATELTPGTALDAGCGQGIDAIWLAARGWQVIAVDFVTTALRRARERADAFGAATSGRIDWVQADLNTWTPPEGSFDLVSCYYVHGVAPREVLFRRLASAVAPGGTLLVVGHHPDDRTSTSNNASAELYFTAEEVAAGLEPDEPDALDKADRWNIDVVETRTRRETDFGGHENIRYDAVLRAHKLR